MTPLHPTIHVASSRVGLGVVMALSSVCVVTASDDRRWQRILVHGRPVGEPVDLGESAGRSTTFHLVPDPGIFGDAELPMTVVYKRLKELAVLNPGFQITLDGSEVASHGGLLGYARALAGPVVDRTAHVRHEDEVATVEVAVAWGGAASRTVAYANQLQSEGPHLRGLQQGLMGTEEHGRIALVAVQLRRLVFEGRMRRVVSAEAEPTLCARVRRLVRHAVQHTKDVAA